MIKRPLCLAAVLLLGVQLLMTGVFQVSEDLKPSPLEQTVTDGENVTLSGTVYRREERPDYRMFYLTDVQIRRDEQFINESKILVYIKQNETQKLENQNSETIAVGNRVRLNGEVSFFEPASNPGNFDRKFYYQKQGIHAAVWSETAEITDSGIWQIRESLTRLRIRWKHLLTGVLGEYYGNCMSAILLGDKSELDAEVKELYQKSGIGHILAISGLHMSFLGIGLYQLLRKTGLSFLPAGGVGILFLLLYTLMIGSGVSSQRALIMFIVRVGADMTGRDYDLPTSLAVAAAVITIRQPLYLFDAGFLLSFGALVGIAVVNPMMDKLCIFPKILRASMSIHLVLLPILLYYYFEIPTWSLFLNLLVIPMMSAVLGAGVFGSLITLLWSDGGRMALQICKLILWIYERAAAFTVELPFGRVVLGQPDKWWCAVYYAVLFGGCAVFVKVCKIKEKGSCTENKKTVDEKNERKRTENFMECCREVKKWYKKFIEQIIRTMRFQKIGIELLKSCLVILYIIVFCVGSALSHRRDGEMQITMIDVGQGDSLYVRTPFGQHYLIDGGSTSESEVGKYRIEPFLKSQGAGRLEYVFVSHGDADHINGIEELLSNQELGIWIDTLVLPTEQVLDEQLLELAELAEESGTRVVTMESRQQIIDEKSDEEMLLTCLAPSQEYTGEIGNASSMVLELDYKDFEMLFTGDLEGEGEEQLIESGQLKDVDILKAGHHGSKNSTSEELLELISSEITLISAGRDNRYRHPHEETLERIENAGSKVYSTQESGAVTVRTDGEKMSFERYLEN